MSKAAFLESKFHWCLPLCAAAVWRPLGGMVLMWGNVILWGNVLLWGRPLYVPFCVVFRINKFQWHWSTRAELNPMWSWHYCDTQIVVISLLIVRQIKIYSGPRSESVGPRTLRERYPIEGWGDTLAAQSMVRQTFPCQVVTGVSAWCRCREIVPLNGHCGSY